MLLPHQYRPYRLAESEHRQTAAKRANGHPSFSSSRQVLCFLCVDKNIPGELPSRHLNWSVGGRGSLGRGRTAWGNQDMPIMFSELVTLGTATPGDPTQLKATRWPCDGFHWSGAEADWTWAGCLFQNPALAPAQNTGLASPEAAASSALSGSQVSAQHANWTGAKGLSSLRPRP